MPSTPDKTMRLADVATSVAADLAGARAHWERGDHKMAATLAMVSLEATSEVLGLFDGNQQTLLEEFVEQFGETYRAVIASALDFIDTKGHEWPGIAIDRETFVECLLEYASGGPRQ